VSLHFNLEESIKILQGAANLFMRIGIKSVSMDDIARELGVSKKTIYKHFSDKKDLVLKVIETDMEREMLSCNTCYNTDENAVQKMIDISKHISHQHKDINPTVIFDLQKYYPSAWAKINTFRTDFISNKIIQNIEEGQNETLYRQEIKPKIAAAMYVTLIQGMMQQMIQGDNNYDFKTLHLQMVSYHLFGICTQEGRSYLEQHINEITNE
jgi:AcrR family transcriptional regulator